MLRFLFSAVLALLVSLALFLLMEQLVNHERPVLAAREPAVRVDISRIKTPEQQPQQPQEPAPQQPAMEPLSASLPAASALAIPDTLSQTELAITTPQWNNSELAIEQKYWSPPVAGGGNGQAGDYLGEMDNGRKEIVPIATRRPNIPKVAYDNRINGWVLLAFTVANDGKVKNIRIMDAEPRGVFEANAIAAVRGWIYTPFKGEERHISQRIEFEWSMYSYNMNFE